MNNNTKTVAGEGNAPRVNFELTDGKDIFERAYFATTQDWQRANDEAYKATDGNLWWRLISA